MVDKERLHKWAFGALFGAWLGAAYAVTANAINWIFLPNIPLMAPGGSFSVYFFQYVLVGALLGWVSALPEARIAGVAVGGLSLTILISILALRSEWGMVTLPSTILIVLLAFLPLTILMMPFSFLIRLGLDSQVVDPSRPYLWARKFLIPAVLTIVVMIAGSLSLYDKPARQAFRYTDAMIQEGQRAASENALPAPLQDIQGFVQNAKGTYELGWSDRLDTFIGPRPAGAEMSQFLIIGRFQNGFTFACVFGANQPVPICTNY